MEAPWTILAAVLLGAILLYWLLNGRPDARSLDWENARRKIRQHFKKPDSFYEFIVNSRGVEIFTKRWFPQSSIELKGLVFYCHGYGDTCAFFWEDVAIKLAQANYGVFGMDYEGHGQSAGLHCYIPRFDTIVDDVVEYCDQVKGKKEFHGLPAFIYGESMGGAVALKVCLRQSQAWGGAIFLAPMCKISDEMMPPPLMIVILKALARLFPMLKAVPTHDICDFAFRELDKRQKARENPTAYKGKPRLRTALEMLKATQDIEEHLPEVNIPMLILHGGADTVTDPSISQALYEQACSKDKTMHLYKDSWHALTEGEPDDVVERVLTDLLTWLDQRSSGLLDGATSIVTEAVKEVDPRAVKNGFHVDS
eukprot:SM000143S00737  [mRNA]  locus=s143:181514:183990:- [translate_table: standard]